MTFRSEAVRELWDEVGALSHPQYPFLSPCYSPNSYMPTCDFTTFVAKALLSKDIDAIYELWGFLLHQDELLELALKATVPQGVAVSPETDAELRATYLLTTRMSYDNSAACTGAAVAATILSTQSAEISNQGIDTIRTCLAKELNDLKRSEWAELDVEEKLEESFSALNQGTKGCDNFAVLMASVPPMVRITFAHAIKHDKSDLYNARLNFGNSYGERVYGCSEIIGQSIANSLKILCPPDVNEIGVGSKVTKAALMSGLVEHNVQFKKSATRDELIAIAQSVPGLLQSVQDKCDPDILVIRKDLATEAKIWAKRNNQLYWLATSLLTAMGRTTNTNIPPTTLTDLLNNQLQMANGLRKHREYQASSFRNDAARKRVEKEIYEAAIKVGWNTSKKVSAKTLKHGHDDPFMFVLLIVVIVFVLFVAILLAKLT